MSDGFAPSAEAKIADSISTNGHVGAPRRRGRPRTVAETLEAARRRKETALADLREDEVKKRREKLIPADDVSREWANILRMVRAGVMAVTSRVRTRLPHLTPYDAQVIDDELRLALSALADDPSPQS